MSMKSADIPTFYFTLLTEGLIFLPFTSLIEVSLVSSGNLQSTDWKPLSSTQYLKDD